MNFYEKTEELVKKRKEQLEKEFEKVCEIIFKAFNKESYLSISFKFDYNGSGDITTCMFGPENLSIKSSDIPIIIDLYYHNEGKMLRDFGYYLYDKANLLLDLKSNIFVASLPPII